MSAYEKTVTVQAVSPSKFDTNKIFSVNVHPPMQDIAAQGLSNALLTNYQKPGGRAADAETVHIVGQDEIVGTAFIIETTGNGPRTAEDLGKVIGQLIDHAGLVDINVVVPERE